MTDDETPKPPKKIGGANTHKYSGPGHGSGPLPPHRIEMRKLRDRLASETPQELRARILKQIAELKENPPMPKPPEPAPERNIVFDESIGMWTLIHPTDGPVYVSANFTTVQAAAYEYGIEPDVPSTDDLHAYREHMANQRQQLRLNEQVDLYIQSRAEPDVHIRVELHARPNGEWELRAPNQGGGVLFSTPDEALAYTTGMGFTIFAEGHEAKEALHAAIERRRGEDPGNVGVEPPEPEPTPTPDGAEAEPELAHDALPDYVLDAMGPELEPGPHPVEHDLDDLTPAQWSNDAPTPAPDFEPHMGPTRDDDAAELHAWVEHVEPGDPEFTPYADQLHAAAEQSPNPALTHTTAVVVSQMPEPAALARKSTATVPEEATPTPPHLRPQPNNGIKLTRR